MTSAPHVHRLTVPAPYRPHPQIDVDALNTQVAEKAARKAAEAAHDR